MKKIGNALLICIAVLTVVGVTKIVRAQQNNITAGQNTRNSSDYVLPYPGILPDHPLYPLKMMRDNLISLFISNPQKKGEFYLLMADKRINAGKYLVDKGKYELGESTVSKGQNYFDHVIDLVVGERKNYGGMNSFLETMNKAAQKHDEVITSLIKKVPEKNKPALRNALEHTKGQEEKILQLKNSKY